MATKKIIRTTLLEAAKRAVIWLRIGRAVLFLGPSGMGKSEVFRDLVCTELAQFHEGYDKLPVLLDKRLSTCAAVDLRGIPHADAERRLTEWFTPEEWPTQGPGVIFFDEITHGEKDALHASYQLILEGQLAEYTVPKDVYLVAAGNRPQDGCGLRKLDAGLRQRFAVFEVEPSAELWREWAFENDVHEPIIAATFIYPELIEGWDGSIDEQQATARELTALSSALKLAGERGVDADQTLGFANDVVGEAAALKLAPFIQNYAGIVPLQDVFESPHTARVPEYDEFDQAIAVSIAIAKNAKPKEVENALAYVDRLPVAIRALFSKSFPILASERAVRAKAWENWLIDNQNLTL